MILEIISRLVSGLYTLIWLISFICIKKHKRWEMICVGMSVVIFVIGFVELLCNVFGV